MEMERQHAALNACAAYAGTRIVRQQTVQEGCTSGPRGSTACRLVQLLLAVVRMAVTVSVPVVVVSMCVPRLDKALQVCGHRNKLSRYRQSSACAVRCSQERELRADYGCTSTHQKSRPVFSCPVENPEPHDRSEENTDLPVCLTDVRCRKVCNKGERSSEVGDCRLAGNIRQQFHEKNDTTSQSSETCGVDVIVVDALPYSGLRTAPWPCPPPPMRKRRVTRMMSVVMRSYEL